MPLLNKLHTKIMNAYHVLNTNEFPPEGKYAQLNKYAHHGCLFVLKIFVPFST